MLMEFLKMALSHSGTNLKSAMKEVDDSLEM